MESGRGGCKAVEYEERILDFALFGLFSVRLCLFAGNCAIFFARRHGDFFFAWFPGTLFLNFRTRGNFKSKKPAKTAKSFGTR
jgi:hypothetical protein